MNFQESLDYLYGLQVFGVKLGLQNMQALENRLAALRAQVPCVHIAGTNGKGSVSTYLAEILRHSGLRVGLYTSPHLHCFSERIRIDGAPLSHERIASLAAQVRRAAEDIPVTFFEATTAIAMMAFREDDVDIAVIETGLGGRLDATNIVRPMLCLVTPVSLDHREHLGDSLAAIAGEKAGIIKPGVPVVSGLQDAEAAAVLLNVAFKNKSTLQMAGRDYYRQGTHAALEVRGPDYVIDGLSCVLPGDHQLDNLAQAVAAAMQLREQGVPVTDEAIRLAGRTASWPGRLEWWRGARQILLDVAHNRAGISSLADYLRHEGLSKVRLVVGMSGERDPGEVLMPLAGIASQLHAVPVSQATSVATDRIVRWGLGQGIPSLSHVLAPEGLAAARQDACRDEPVVVCGSLYLVAELRQHLMEQDCAAATRDAVLP